MLSNSIVTFNVPTVTMEDGEKTYDEQTGKSSEGKTKDENQKDEKQVMSGHKIMMKYCLKGEKQIGG